MAEHSLSLNRCDLGGLVLGSRALHRGLAAASGNTKRIGAHGFSLVEILMVMFLIGLVALPFTRMFLFGAQGSQDTSEHIVAYFLAREKMDEALSIPFSRIKSDFEVFRNLYRDRPNLEDAFESRDVFEKTFSDVFTEHMLQADDENKITFDRFKDLYAETYHRPYDLYPDSAGAFRRILEVDETYDMSMPPQLKKLIVKVFTRQGKKIAEIVTLVSRER